MPFSEKQSSIYFYVSPTGSDAHPGDEARPFATITRARDVIRKLKNVNSDITVFIKGGEYYLDEPISLDERDSGRGNFKVIYRNYPGENPEIIGGKSVSGWEPVMINGQNGYKAKVGTDWKFYSLYERDIKTKEFKRAIIARTPKDPEGRYQSSFHVVDHQSMQSFSYDLDEIQFNSGSDEYKQLQVFIWVGAVHWRWMAETIPVADIDRENHIITLKHPIAFSDFNPVEPGVCYFLQNSLGFLEESGEFFLDEDVGEVYYIPYDMETDINCLEIIAPTVKKIFDLKGSSPWQFIRNVQIQGLKISVSDFHHTYLCSVSYAKEFGGSDLMEGYEHRQALIYLQNAAKIEVKFCKLANAGYNGVLMDSFSKNNTLYGNHIRDIGGTGICLMGSLKEDADNVANLIRNNYINGCGRNIGHGAGIQLLRSCDNLVSHNFVETGPRYGISMKGARPMGDDGKVVHHLDTSGNRIEFNLFRDLMYGTRDCGYIESFWCGHNIIHNNRAYQCQAFDDPGYGIMMDDHTNYNTITNNITFDYLGGNYQCWDDVGNKFLQKEYCNYKAFGEEDARKFAKEHEILWDEVGLEEDFPEESRPEVLPGWTPKPRRYRTNGGLRIFVVDYDDMFGVVDRGYTVGNCTNGDWLMFRDIDLGCGYQNVSIYLNSACQRFVGETIKYEEGHMECITKEGLVEKTEIELRIDRVDGPLISTVEVPDTGSYNWQKWFWQVVQAPLKRISGRHDLYFVFKGGGPDNGMFLYEVAQVEWLELNPL
ncbi:MAG: carbohydrate-binding protein [Vallitaleaceae bacterium]|nr:carbohydrate-binding protein [Vallitaleaceae bacterium]